MTSKKKKGIIWGSVAVVLIVAVIVVLVCFVRFAPKINNELFKSITPVQYEVARDFSEGYAAVKVGDQWGFIDINGDLVIEAKYEGTGAFSEGLCAVQQDGK